MDPILKQSLDWYTFLSAQPGGWKEQSIHSVNALAKQWPQMYGELPRLLAEAMDKRAIEASVKRAKETA